MSDQCAIIVLAAGASSRLGKPKQTLLFKQSTLLEHSIHEALNSVATYVIVVLGADAAAIKPSIQNTKLSFTVNEHWQEGIASSIRCGLEYLLTKHSSVPAILLTVCDQPYINTALIDKLVTLQAETGVDIVASRYGDTKGIPAVFGKRLFSELLKLKGDAGAKKIIMNHPESQAVIDFPLGAIDIDTQEDYISIQKKEKN